MEINEIGYSSGSDGESIQSKLIRYVEIGNLLDQLRPRSILDYGAGQALLSMHLGNLNPEIYDIYDVRYKTDPDLFVTAMFNAQLYESGMSDTRSCLGLLDLPAEGSEYDVGIVCSVIQDCLNYDHMHNLFKEVSSRCNKLIVVVRVSFSSIDKKIPDLYLPSIGEVMYSLTHYYKAGSLNKLEGHLSDNYIILCEDKL